MARARFAAALHVVVSLYFVAHERDSVVIVQLGLPSSLVAQIVVVNPGVFNDGYTFEESKVLKSSRIR